MEQQRKFQKIILGQCRCAASPKKLGNLLAEAREEREENKSICSQKVGSQLVPGKEQEAWAQLSLKPSSLVLSTVASHLEAYTFDG